MGLIVLAMGVQFALTGTAPQKQEDLYDNGSNGASTGEAGDDVLTKPQTSNPAP
jgi:hypothetical protein